MEIVRQVKAATANRMRRPPSSQTNPTSGGVSLLPRETSLRFGLRHPQKGRKIGGARRYRKYRIRGGRRDKRRLFYGANVGRGGLAVKRQSGRKERRSLVRTSGTAGMPSETGSNDQCEVLVPLCTPTSGVRCWLSLLDPTKNPPWPDQRLVLRKGLINVVAADISLRISSEPRYIAANRAIGIQTLT